MSDSDPVLPEQPIAKVEVDRELCIGAASCIALAPDAFFLDGESTAVVKPGWTGLTRAQLLDAAKSCPVAAIFLYGPGGERLYPER